MRKVEKWLALPDDKLVLELGRVFTPEPWKHDWIRGVNFMSPTTCTKCGCDNSQASPPQHCPVPDPIKLDWNTAKYWQRKCNEKDFCEAIWSVYEAECVHMPDEDSGHWVSWLFERWIVSGVDSTKWLIAAAMVMEGKPE